MRGNMICALCIAGLVVAGCSKDPENNANNNGNNSGSDAGVDMATSGADTGTDMDQVDQGADVTLVNPDPCDPIAQDCVEDGASKCVIKFAEPADDIDALQCEATLGVGGLGESCQRPNGLAGEDDCAPGLYCGYWGLPAGDPQERKCHQLCTSNDQCSDTESCHGMDPAGTIGFCAEGCDPRADDCVAGTKCGIHRSTVLDDRIWWCDFDTGVSVGTSCNASWDCGAGQACLGEGVGRTCRAVCTDDFRCSDGGACADIMDVPGWGLCEDVDWSCAGTPWPAPTVTDSDVTIHAINVVDGSDVEGATVSACAADDVDCAAPLATGMTAANGRVNLLVPTGTAGFDGYFEVNAAGFDTQLLYARTPMLDATGGAQAVLSVIEDVPWVGGFTADPTRGQIVSVVSPCNPRDISIDVGGGAQVVLTSDLADGSTTTAYFSEILPTEMFDPGLMSTTITGLAAMGNHPAGVTTLTYTNSESTVVATRPVVVRADAVTFVWVVPTP